MTRQVQHCTAYHTLLDSVSLAHFAIDDGVYYRNRQQQHDDTDNVILSSQSSTVHDISNVITLEDGLGKMHRHKMRVILMSHDLIDSHGLSVRRWFVIVRNF